MTHHSHHEDSGRNKDLVCGMTVEPGSENFLDFEGARYYFCSAGCKAKFESDPSAYAAKRLQPQR